jgi:hypothetical protein
MANMANASIALLAMSIKEPACGLAARAQPAAKQRPLATDFKQITDRKQIANGF